MNEIYHKLHEIGIIPVVVLNDSKDALPLGKALIKGSLPAAEVTFRTDAAAEAIHQLSEAYPELLVGAGTVLSIEQADLAIHAGARFIVSPGLNPKVVRHCLEKNVVIIPGVVTPSEIEQALELGLDIVKFFPAEPSGGLAMIQALSAAYTKLRFMPTGGINAENVIPYLKSDKIIACGGSWMVKKEMIAAGDFEKISVLCQNAADIVLSLRG